MSWIPIPIYAICSNYAPQSNYYVPEVQHFFSLTLLDLQHLRGTRKTVDVHKLYKAI